MTGELQSYGIYIKTQPKDAVCYGDKAAVYETEAVFGVGELTYTWQSRGKDDADWQDITEANGENGKKRIKISAGTEWNDSQIRCRITDEAGTAVYTTTASLTVREENLTAKMAAEQLYEWYEANGISTIFALHLRSTMLSAVSIRWMLPSPGRTTMHLFIMTAESRRGLFSIT